MSVLTVIVLFQVTIVTLIPRVPRRNWIERWVCKEEIAGSNLRWGDAGHPEHHGHRGPASLGGGVERIVLPLRCSGKKMITCIFSYQKIP